MGKRANNEAAIDSARMAWPVCVPLIDALFLICRNAVMPHLIPHRAWNHRYYPAVVRVYGRTSQTPNRAYLIRHLLTSEMQSPGPALGPLSFPSFCLPLLLLLLGEWPSGSTACLSRLSAQHPASCFALPYIHTACIAFLSIQFAGPLPRCVPGSPFGSPSPAQAMPVDVNA